MPAPTAAPGGSLRLQVFGYIHFRPLTRRTYVSYTHLYGQFTPTEREVVSLGLVQTVVQAYYEHINAEDFLKSIPCVDTTEETKRCMGLIK